MAFVLKLMASGMTYTEILAVYPELERAELYQALSDHRVWHLSGREAGEYHRPLNVATM